MGNCLKEIKLLITQAKKYGGGKNWKALAGENSPVSNEKLFASLQTYQSLIATLSGLISGFSYVVLSQERIEYKTNHFLGSNRSDVSAGFVTFAFLASLSCLIVASTLYFYAAFGGESNVKNWVKRTSKFLDMPVFMLITSIGFILIGSVIHIGGFYNDVMYYCIIIVASLLLIGYIWLQFILLRHQFDFLDKMKQNRSKENKTNVNVNENDFANALQTAAK
eukprot:552334_1